MKYLFYTTSDSAWDGLTEAMQHAQHSIYLEMYIFVDDTEKSRHMVELLCAKARAGVNVSIVLDGFGSADLSKEAEKNMKEAGVEVLYFTKWFRRLHKKIVIVDERVGFLGGVNIHESARWWNDLLVRLEGPIVRSLLRSFRRTYKFCGGKNEHILSFRGQSVLGHTRLWILEHVPGIRKPRLKDAYTESIHKAKNRIVLVTPYFLPHKWLIKLLKSAVEKKIEVHIIVPETTDIPMLTSANLYYINLLAKAGVKFYQIPTMTHAKLLLIDESLAFVGSQNIDALSFDFNTEVGIFFTDKKMIVSLVDIIEKWKSDSHIFAPIYITIWQRMFSYVVRFLQPVL